MQTSAFAFQIYPKLAGFQNSFSHARIHLKLTYQMNLRRNRFLKTMLPFFCIFMSICIINPDNLVFGLIRLHCIGILKTMISHYSCKTHKKPKWIRFIQPFYVHCCRSKSSLCGRVNLLNTSSYKPLKTTCSVFVCKERIKYHGGDIVRSELEEYFRMSLQKCFG